MTKINDQAYVADFLKKLDVLFPKDENITIESFEELEKLNKVLSDIRISDPINKGLFDKDGNGRLSISADFRQYLENDNNLKKYLAKANRFTGLYQAVEIIREGVSALDDLNEKLKNAAYFVSSKEELFKNFPIIEQDSDIALLKDLKKQLEAPKIQDSNEAIGKLSDDYMKTQAIPAISSTTIHTANISILFEVLVSSLPNAKKLLEFLDPENTQKFKETFESVNYYPSCMLADKVCHSMAYRLYDVITSAEYIKANPINLDEFKDLFQEMGKLEDVKDIDSLIKNIKLLDDEGSKLKSYISSMHTKISLECPYLNLYLIEKLKSVKDQKNLDIFKKFQMIDYDFKTSEVIYKDEGYILKLKDLLNSDEKLKSITTFDDLNQSLSSINLLLKMPSGAQLHHYILNSPLGKSLGAKNLAEFEQKLYAKYEFELKDPAYGEFKTLPALPQKNETDKGVTKSLDPKKPEEGKDDIVCMMTLDQFDKKITTPPLNTTSFTTNVNPEIGVKPKLELSKEIAKTVRLFLEGKADITKVVEEITNDNAIKSDNRNQIFIAGLKKKIEDFKLNKPKDFVDTVSQSRMQKASAVALGSIIVSAVALLIQSGVSSSGPLSGLVNFCKSNPKIAGVFMLLATGASIFGLYNSTTTISEADKKNEGILSVMLNAELGQLDKDNPVVTK